MTLRNKEKTVVIVIPVYKAKLEGYELISLKQCLSVLRNHPIKFIGPGRLNTDFYKEICGEYYFSYISFPDFYFSSVAGYNKLMLSGHFYKTFFEYKYLLIHQLDAYVFKDDLLYWCGKNYDFIGAPHPIHQNLANEMKFLSGYSKWVGRINRLFKTDHAVSNVGNGGFSLRKIKSCYWLVKVLRKKVISWGSHNEDGFFKYWGNIFYPLFKLPPDELALHFSIEQSVADSLKILDNRLPFGCHAFEKYEWEAWEPFIH